MSNHVAVGKVDYDEVVFVFLYRGHEFVFHLVCAHFGLEVIGSHLGRSHERAFLAGEGLFASAVEEERYVCVFLCLCGVQLFQPFRAEVFAECVVYVFFGEEDVHILEIGVVRRHAVELKSRNGGHSLFGHVFLGENVGYFACAVVAVVEEDNHVAFLNASVNVGVYERLHEFIGVLVLGRVAVVAVLHGFYKVVHFFAFAVHELVVSHLDAVPAFVAVHGVETAYYRCYCAYGVVAVVYHFLNEAFAAARVGVASVHEAVHVGVVNAVFLGYVDEFEQVLQFGVHAAVRG